MSLITGGAKYSLHLQCKNSLIFVMPSKVFPGTTSNAHGMTSTQFSVIYMPGLGRVSEDLRSLPKFSKQFHKQVIIFQSIGCCYNS
jgi:hypothetical protein